MQKIMTLLRALSMMSLLIAQRRIIGLLGLVISNEKEFFVVLTGGNSPKISKVLDVSLKKLIVLNFKFRCRVV